MTLPSPAALIALLLVVSLGCAREQGNGSAGGDSTVPDITGTYMLTGSQRTVQFTKSGNFLTSAGDAGSYTVEAGKVIVIHPFGGASGSINGNEIVFPTAKSETDFVGQHFQGTWVKQ